MLYAVIGIAAIYIIWYLWYILIKDHTKIVERTVTVRETPPVQPVESFPILPIPSPVELTYTKYYWAIVNGQWQLAINPKPDDFEEIIIYPNINPFITRDSLWRFTEKRYKAKKHQVFVWQNHHLNNDLNFVLDNDANNFLNYFGNWICLFL